MKQKAPEGRGYLSITARRRRHGELLWALFEDLKHSIQKASKGIGSSHKDGHMVPVYRVVSRGERDWAS